MTLTQYKKKVSMSGQKVIISGNQMARLRCCDPNPKQNSGGYTAPSNSNTLPASVVTSSEYRKYTPAPPIESRKKK
jgi:hypothetical protein